MTDSFRTLSICQPSIDVGDKTANGSSSDDVSVRNNLANALSVYNLDAGVTADHNVGMATSGAVFAWYVSGVAKWYGSAGTYGNANIIAAGGPTAEFVNFDPPNMTYNVMLKAGAPAIGAASLGPTRADRRHPGGHANCSMRRRGLFVPGVIGRVPTPDCALPGFARALAACAG